MVKVLTWSIPAASEMVEAMIALPLMTTKRKNEGGPHIESLENKGKNVIMVYM